MGDINYIGKYKEMREKNWSGIWAKRILSELSYLIEVSDADDKKYKDLLEQEIEKIYQYVQVNGAITKEMALEAEADLESMKGEAKKYSVLLIAHAHMDMNWMWGFNETASLTIDTIKTMLKLMEEYPDFIFSQSQASVYKIAEQYHPELLDEIRQRVHEGRWEVTASTWVENDKNMSGNEAIIRQMLYAKKYLSKLLDIKEETLEIDFEPDTFGHNINMPEILNAGGIKYYYHCRGYNKEHVYRWRAPSGAEVIVYREPIWYNDSVAEYDGLAYVPSFCRKYGLHTAMKLYGVGDHGGGPTRKQIERWIEMQQWPLMPEIRFGTLREFFKSLEAVREQLPLVEGELNYIFTGCYTTQSRIKRANKLGEDRIKESEAIDALAHITLPEYRTPSQYDKAWEKILFNQFHDILPGSGVTDTREYAMGVFQEAAAASQISMNHALGKLCENIDTTCFSGCKVNSDESYGAGAGFGTDNASGVLTGFVGRSGGKKRLISVFNPTQYDRKEFIKVVLWDWDGDLANICIKDAEGNIAEHDVLKERVEYWAHIYHELLIFCDVKAFGYQTYVIEDCGTETLGIEWAKLSTSPAEDPRVDHITDMPVILENKYMKAIFAPDTMKLLSLLDKESNREKITVPSGMFHYVVENPVNEMTSWRVGSYTKSIDLNENAHIRVTNVCKKRFIQKAEYEIPFGESNIKVNLVLRENSKVLEYEVKIDWREFGSIEKGIPQLNFSVPSGQPISRYYCAVPMGIIEREPIAQDVPCIGFMAGQYKDEKDQALMLMSDCKYGFRGYNDAVQVTLLRGAFDPDKTPDIGEHSLKLGIGLCSSDLSELNQAYEKFVHPMYTCSHSAHSGQLPLSGQFIEMNGKSVLTALKSAEDKNGIVMRFINLYNEKDFVRLKCRKSIVKAEKMDALENKIADLRTDDTYVHFTVEPNAIATIRVVL